MGNTKICWSRILGEDLRDMLRKRYITGEQIPRYLRSPLQVGLSLAKMYIIYLPRETQETIARKIQRSLIFEMWRVRRKLRLNTRRRYNT